jgi:hypothetical protein
MYGMIHQAARKMAIESMGEARWRDILAEIGFDEEHFISGRHYDDATTFALVGAVSKASGMAMDPLLEAFGRYWIGFAGASSYGRMLDVAGETFEELIESLDRMHASIKSTMPEASMPGFEVLESNGAAMELRYSSERTGLNSFVVGLLKGLLDRFGEVGEITPRAASDGGVIFSIAREMRAA